MDCAHVEVTVKTHQSLLMDFPYVYVFLLNTNSFFSQNGRLSCHHKVCPRTATCPPDRIVSPLPGECCPTCSGCELFCMFSDMWYMYTVYYVINC